jgi:hypothetical protein
MWLPSSGGVSHVLQQAVARMTSVSRPVTEAHLEARQLSSTQWRITDPLRPEHGDIDLVAFIELVDGRFEVLRIGFPLEHERFDSFEGAMAFVASGRRSLSDQASA